MWQHVILSCASLKSVGIPPSIGLPELTRCTTLHQSVLN